LIAGVIVKTRKELARKTLETIRCKEPARRVGGGRKNVSGFYPSRKMGKTIQFESHKVELPFIYELEHDEDVLEFYDQPPPFKINYQSESGRNLGFFYTPDFFVIRTTRLSGWSVKQKVNCTRKLSNIPAATVGEKKVNRIESISDLVGIDRRRAALNGTGLMATNLVRTLEALTRRSKNSSYLYKYFFRTFSLYFKAL
jgi:hypothetical protein